MKNDIAISNESFSFLKQSDSFLNLVLNNINSCVLLLDKDLKLQAFNDPLKNIFTKNKDEDLLYVRCGDAIGCANQVDEQKQCGTTSQCNFCELRISAMSSYINGEEIFHNGIEREFFNYQGQRETKKIDFSTRLFNFLDEKYILMIIDGE